VTSYTVLKCGAAALRAERPDGPESVGPPSPLASRSSGSVAGSQRLAGLSLYSSMTNHGPPPADISFLQIGCSGSLKSHTSRSRTGGSPIDSNVRRSPGPFDVVDRRCVMAGSGIGTLTVNGLLPAEPPWAREAFRGGELVSLVVAVPMLAGTLIAVHRGSLRAQALWIGMLLYAAYNYAYADGTQPADGRYADLRHALLTSAQGGAERASSALGGMG
jgi:hypothetical protein